MKILKTLLVLLFLGTIAALILLLPKQIKIQSINCSSQYGPCNEEVEKKFNSLLGKSIPEGKKEISEYLDSQSLINDYSIQFKLPAILEVDIVEKKPQFSIFAFDSGVFYLIDKDGQIVKIENGNNLPLVKIQSFSGKVGEKVSQDKLFALDLTYRLFTSYQIKETEITENYLVAIMPEGIKVLFPLEGDKDVLLGGLTMIMSRLNESVKESKIDISQIDLRFKNPVLK